MEARSEAVVGEFLVDMKELEQLLNKQGEQLRKLKISHRFTVRLLGQNHRGRERALLSALTNEVEAVEQKQPEQPLKLQITAKERQEEALRKMQEQHKQEASSLIAKHKKEIADLMASQCIDLKKKQLSWLNGMLQHAEKVPQQFQWMESQQLLNELRYPLSLEELCYVFQLILYFNDQYNVNSKLPTMSKDGFTFAKQVACIDYVKTNIELQRNSQSFEEQQRNDRWSNDNALVTLSFLAAPQPLASSSQASSEMRHEPTTPSVTWDLGQ